MLKCLFDHCCSYVTLTNVVHGRGIDRSYSLAGQERPPNSPAETRGAKGHVMATQHQLSFDPKSFLAKIGEGRSIGRYCKDEIVISQGDPANAVFYVQSGKVKVSIISRQGKEAIVAIHETNDFFGEGCLAGQMRRIATVAATMDS